MTTPFATQSGLMLRRKKALVIRVWRQFAKSLLLCAGIRWRHR